MSKAAAVPAAPPEPGLVPFSTGALIVQKPQDYSSGGEAFNMLDEDPATGWAAAKGVTGDQVMVIELPERTILRRLEFDTARLDANGGAASSSAAAASKQPAPGGIT
jgi:hypothetical protein